MTSTLQEEQQPVFERMASALIEATPESWPEATLELIPRGNSTVLGLAHSIFSTVGHREVIQATPELFEATQELQDISMRHADSWQKCVFQVVQEGEAWRFVVNFHR